MMQDLHLRTFYGLRPSKPPHSSTLPIIHGHAPGPRKQHQCKNGTPKNSTYMNPRKLFLTVWFSKRAKPSRERGNRTHNAPGLSRRPLPIGISHADTRKPRDCGASPCQEPELRSNPRQSIYTIVYSQQALQQALQEYFLHQ